MNLSLAGLAARLAPLARQEKYTRSLTAWSAYLLEIRSHSQMAIDHAREAALLSYALELAATCSSQFHAHVSGMIQDICSGAYALTDLSLDEIRDDIAMFRQESPAELPINLPVGIEVLQVTTALVDMAFAEIAHRVKWGIVMAKHMDANEFLVKIFRDATWPGDRTGQD